MIAEKIVLDHLSDRLTVPVLMESRPDLDTYVLIERVGGSERNFIRRASFAIQSYGSTLLEACELNEKVKAAMRSLIEWDEVTRCDLDSDYEYTDQTLKRYRYQAVYDLVLFL